MSFDAMKPDLVRFEMRMVQGQDPHVREQRKPGGFGRFLSGIGKVLGAIAMPLSFMFPPAALGAAGMYGLGALGDGMQARTAKRTMEKMQREQNTMVSFPGLDVSGGSQLSPAAFDMATGDQDVMKVLDARGHSMKTMAGSI